MSSSPEKQNQNLDLTIGLLGKEVPESSPTITWNDGHITILPAIYNESNVNICEDIDIPVIRFISQFPMSNKASNMVALMPNDSLSREGLIDAVGLALSQSRTVVIRGKDNYNASVELSADYLDRTFAISPLRPVCIHDLMLRHKDHVHPTMDGTIDSFFEARTDPTRIQCVLDLALAQTSLPEPLRNLDHGLVYGWNQTAYTVPIKSKVHPENFTVKGWSLLHHAGFFTHPHHDAEGTLTWTRMEVGVKFWIIFKPIGRWEDRMHLQDFVTKLVDLPTHKEWLTKNCTAEIVVLRAGDILIMPPGTVHAVYTPVASFATGGHFYNYMCMHLTELSRYIDAEVADCTTNQYLEHSVETLRRMLIMVPYLSRRTVLFKRSMLGLCMMVIKTHQYRAMGSKRTSTHQSETSEASTEVANAIMEYIGVSTKLRPGSIMYKGNQLMPGGRFDRSQFDKDLRRSLKL